MHDDVNTERTRENDFIIIIIVFQYNYMFNVSMIGVYARWYRELLGRVVTDVFSVRVMVVHGS